MILIFILNNAATNQLFTDYLSLVIQYFDFCTLQFSLIKYQT